MTESSHDQVTQPQAGASRSPEEIEAAIEQTREQLGETVEALAAKTDVKRQLQDRLATAKQEVTGNVAQVKETVAGKTSELSSKAKQASPESASAGAQQLGAKLRENPTPVAAAGAFVLGLAAGRLFRK
jgi:gas vesicle protein